MSDPLIIQTVTQKRAEIRGQINASEAQIANAKHDLALVNATIELLASGKSPSARDRPPASPRPWHRFGGQMIHWIICFPASLSFI